MIETRLVKQRIEEILALCQTAMSMVGKFGSVEHRAAEDKFLEALSALDKEAVEGLSRKDSRCVPGRTVKLGVNDGYAYYILLRVNSKTVKLVHVPFADAYKSHIVAADGEADRMVIEDSIEWQDTVIQAFEKSSREKLIDGVADALAANAAQLPVVEMDAETAEAVAREFANNL